MTNLRTVRKMLMVTMAGPVLRSGIGIVGSDTVTSTVPYIPAIEAHHQWADAKAVTFRGVGASRMIARMKSGLLRFLVFWGVNTLSLWVADDLFSGIAFQTLRSLFIAGLLLGIVNTFVKPLLVLLTLPLSVVTLGFFVLVINALMLLFVAWLVPGFVVSGFWSGFFVALFVSVLSFVVNSLIGINRVIVRGNDRR